MLIAIKSPPNAPVVVEKDLQHKHIQYFWHAIGETTLALGPNIIYKLFLNSTGF
jgi:hypothetical protein